MKLINTLKITTLVILTTLSFTACGDGGSGGSFESDDGTTTGNNSGSGSSSTSGGAIKTIDISIQCATTPTQSDIDSYITLNSGDTISKSGDVTIITYHDSDGIKKVCKDSSSTGSASIVR